MSNGLSNTHVAESSRPLLFWTIAFLIEKVLQLRHSIEHIIREQSERNEELFVTVIKLLTSAANHQPAFFAAILAADEMGSFHSRNMGSSNEQTVDSTVQALKSENATRLVDMLVLNVERSDTLVERNGKVLLSILHLMKALWQGAAQYNNILETIRKSKKFWKQLSESILLASNKETPSAKNLSEGDAQKFSCFYQCQSAALDIMALEIFLQKKVLHADSHVKQADESSKGCCRDQYTSICNFTSC